MIYNLLRYLNRISPPGCHLLLEEITTTRALTTNVITIGKRGLATAVLAFFILCLIFNSLQAQLLPSAAFSECCQLDSGRFGSLAAAQKTPEKVVCLELRLDYWVYKSPADFYADIERLKQFPNLRCLSAHLINVYEYPAALFELTNLTALELWTTAPLAPPAQLAKLKNLRHLSLSRADESTKLALAEMKQLRSFSVLTESPLQALALSAGLDSLKTAQFFCNANPLVKVDFSMGEKQLKGFAHNPPPDQIFPKQYPPSIYKTKLENLTIYFPRNDPDFWNALAESEKLTALTLVTDTLHSPTVLQSVLNAPVAFPVLKRLTFLDVSHCNIDRLPEIVFQMPLLKKIVLKGNPLQANEISTLKARRPDLEIIW